MEYKLFGEILGLRKKDVNLTEGVLTVEQTVVLIRGTIHSLRHGFVSFLLSKNVPPKDVQAIAGHSSFAVTMDIYGHLMEGTHKEAAKKLDGVFKM